MIFKLGNGLEGIIYKAFLETGLKNLLKFILFCIKALTRLRKRYIIGLLITRCPCFSFPSFPPHVSRGVFIARKKRIFLSVNKNQFFERLNPRTAFPKDSLTNRVRT